MSFGVRFLVWHYSPRGWQMLARYVRLSWVS